MGNKVTFPNRLARRAYMGMGAKAHLGQRDYFLLPFGDFFFIHGGYLRCAARNLDGAWILLKDQGQAAWKGSG